MNQAKAFSKFTQKSFPKFLIVFKRVACETNSKDSGNKIFYLISS